MDDKNKYGNDVFLFKCLSQIVIFITVLLPIHVYAVSLGPECEPSGLVAKAKEAWNPKVFWTTQIREIEEYVENQKALSRLLIVDIKRARINERLDAEEMKAMGIEQNSEPELDREMAKFDRESLQMDRQMLNETIEWGRKCTSYAKKKLSGL